MAFMSYPVKVQREKFCVVSMHKLILSDPVYFTSLHVIIKRPARDACLCMGELPAPPAPHFVFLITL